MATSSLYLFNYNNYRNKILKRSETLQGYGAPLVTLRDTNFNPKDYISTQHIFNTWIMDSRVLPDYCVVCDASDEILSRWFVIGVTRMRGGQWRVQLLADLAADHKEELMSATCFIRKGFTASSPFVFNNENMGFNQIKSDEITIENNLHTPWLVLYLARYKGGKQDETDIEFNTFEGEFADEPTTKTTDYTFASLSDYKYYYYSTVKYTAYDIRQVFFGAGYMVTGDERLYEMTQETISGETGFKPKGIYGTPINSAPGSLNYPTFSAGKVLSGNREHWGTMAGEFNGGVITQTNRLPVNTYTADSVSWYNQTGPSNLGTVTGYNALIAENGKTIKVGDNIYRIDIVQEEPPEGTYGTYRISKSSALGAEMRADFLNYNGLTDIPTAANQVYYVHVPLTYRFLSVQFTLLGSATASNPITYDFGYTKAITRDASYEIIAAPYRSVTFTNIPGQEGAFGHSGDVALQWFQAIINKYNGANFAYDLQLVPYCPVDTLDLRTQNVIFCQRGTAKLALAIQIQSSNFSQRFQINRFPWNDNLKLSNELDIYRLVSPNGIGEYEWTPAKNGSPIGSLPYFEVDCTLIPFHPYIKVNPDFGGLYGKDYNDYRGLICSGDFSLPIVNSEWETYQLNNKYYQDIFDRSIQHQEFNNKWAALSDKINAATGTLSGASSGAAAGGMIGGPVGMAVGGVAGGLASGVGGVADVWINQAIREEDISYQKDSFGFELGTIKARSQSLSRTTSFNRNNKYFPYVEYYTCTPQEKQALLDKMTYNGMTIGVIGTIPDYVEPSGALTFVQGEIIEIDINTDAAVVERLNQILQGGIRLSNG